MTKKQFEELQLQLQQSDMNLKTYLKQIGVNYSTYNYWRKKFQSEENDKSKALAPIIFKQPQHLRRVIRFPVVSHHR